VLLQLLKLEEFENELAGSDKQIVDASKRKDVQKRAFLIQAEQYLKKLNKV